VREQGLSHDMMQLTRERFTRLAGLALALTATLLLGGCQSGLVQIGSRAEPTPTVQSPPLAASQTGVVSVTGEVVPARQSMLSFATGGRIVEITVEIGDTVQAGDVIARLDTTLLDAEVRKAEAALAVAQATLAQVQAGPREPQLAEAESNVQAANAAAAVADAQRRVVSAGPRADQIAQAEAAVQQALLQFKAAEDQYRWTRNADPDHPDYAHMPPQQVERIHSWEEDALENYNRAQRALEEARARLNTLLAGPDEDTIRAAEAELWAASAEYRASRANLEELEAGTPEEDIAIARAQVTLAEVALETATIAREQAVLTAPFDGTVAELFVQVGRTVSPGEPVLLLADLSHLRLQTTDLSELDVAAVEEGDPVNITFDALPGETAKGVIAEIAARAAEGQGVNFTTTIDVDAMPEGIRWGMTALVEIPIDRGR